MQDHVIVCGMPQRLRQFLEPFKRSMNGNSIKRSSKSGQTRVFESKSDYHNPDELSCVVPVLFLWDGPISPEILSVLFNPSGTDCARARPACRFCLLLSSRALNSASVHRCSFASFFLRLARAGRDSICECCLVGTGNPN